MTHVCFSFVSNLPCLLQLHRTHINVKSILALLQSPEVVQEMKMFLNKTKKSHGKEEIAAKEIAVKEIVGGIRH